MLGEQMNEIELMELCTNVRETEFNQRHFFTNQLCIVGVRPVGDLV